MKKFLTALIAANLLFDIMSAQTEVGAIAGATFSFYSPKPNGQPEHLFTPGYSFGLISNMTVVPHFVIQPGVHLVTKGGTSTGEIYQYLHNYRTWTAIELPVNFLYKIPWNDKKPGGFSIGGGPSVSFNVAGKFHWTYGTEESMPLAIGNSNDDRLKPLDFGVNAMMGFETSFGLQFLVNYNYGITNLIPGAKGEMRSHYFGVRVAYMFYRSR